MTLLRTVSIKLDSVDSTHAFVKRNYVFFPSHFLTRVRADVQTKGRGQGQKSWQSPPYQNLCVSYFCLFQKPQRDPSSLAHIMTIAGAYLLKENKLSPQIKWPNDLFCSSKKIGGVLGEWLDYKGASGAILSLGLNVNMTDAELGAIDQPATSLYKQTQKTHSIDQLADCLDAHIAQALEDYKREGFAFFYPFYTEHMLGKGRVATYTFQETSYQATLKDISLDGRLALRLPSGEVRLVSSGQVTAL